VYYRADGHQCQSKAIWRSAVTRNTQATRAVLVSIGFGYTLADKIKAELAAWGQHSSVDKSSRNTARPMRL